MSHATKPNRAHLFCTAALLLLASCATGSTWDQDDAATAACFAAMDRDPALAVVNAKFARRDPAPAQLADTARPSPVEADALRLRVAKTKPCRELRLAAVRSHRPLLEPAYTILYYQSDQVFDYLTQRAITYGTANALARDALAAFKQREAAYLAGNGREALAETWRDELQRAHSNPPPGSPRRICTWEALNIACH